MSSAPNDAHPRRSRRLVAQKRSRSVDDDAESKQDEAQARPPKKHPKMQSPLSPSSAQGHASSSVKKHSGASKSVMTSFMKSYKGVDDWHLPLFNAVRQYLAARGIPDPEVFYPGCHKHVQASLVFPKVTYVDFDTKLNKHFSDPGIKHWIESNKTFDAPSEWTFECRDFAELPPSYAGRFDLMISACAGFVVEPCGHTLKVGTGPNSKVGAGTESKVDIGTGYLLVSDAHFDARASFVDPRFELAAVWSGDDQKLVDGEEDLAGHFTTAGGAPITAAQVAESAAKQKRARSFRLLKEAMFYLFRRVA